MGFVFFGIYRVVVLRVVHMVFSRNTGSCKRHFGRDWSAGIGGDVILLGRFDGDDLRLPHAVCHSETLIETKKGKLRE